MYEGVIQHLIDELGRLPGVGPKGAQRIAFALLAGDPEDVRRLASALIVVSLDACGTANVMICTGPKKSPMLGGRSPGRSKHVVAKTSDTPRSTTLPPGLRAQVSAAWLTSATFGSQ